LNIARINARDQHTKGTFKSMSRLLKTLRADSLQKIDLKDAEINAIVYSIPMEDLLVEPKKLLSLLPKVDAKLNKLHMDTGYFNSLLSPSEKDRVFAGRPDKQAEIGKLRDELSKLIRDLKSDLESKGQSLDSDISYG